MDKENKMTRDEAVKTIEILAKMIEEREDELKVLIESKELIERILDENAK